MISLYSNAEIQPYVVYPRVPDNAPAGAPRFTVGPRDAGAFDAVCVSAQSADAVRMAGGRAPLVLLGMMEGKGVVQMPPERPGQR